MDYSPEDISPGVESFDQLSQIAFNNADKARAYDNDQKHNNSHQIYTKNTS